MRLASSHQWSDRGLVYSSCLKKTRTPDKTAGYGFSDFGQEPAWDWSLGRRWALQLPQLPAPGCFQTSVSEEGIQTELECLADWEDRFRKVLEIHRPRVPAGGSWTHIQDPQKCLLESGWARLHVQERKGWGKTLKAKQCLAMSGAHMGQELVCAPSDRVEKTSYYTGYWVQSSEGWALAEVSH